MFATHARSTRFRAPQRRRVPTDHVLQQDSRLPHQRVPGGSRMNQTMYLVDSNALVALKRHRIRSAYFRTYCRVTADVLREAREHPDRSVLVKDVRELTPAVLEQIRAVMKTVGVGDTGLVDLYKNKGAADPGLIASALEA